MEFISEASFWIPELFVESDWIEHAPFAFWLVQTLRPRILVEVGSHRGFSYFVFNQAQERLGVKTRCFAIDPWPDEEVFESVQAHDARYSDFSQLIRSNTEEAAGYFADESIDLLHIDGRCFYHDVKRDFENLRPKLSSRSLVLFHDTNVRTHDFGVFQLWDELAAVYPHFEFLHGRGLGLLGVGAEIPFALRTLLEASRDVLLRTQTQNAYARLGKFLLNSQGDLEPQRLDGEGETLEELRLLTRKLQNELSTNRREELQKRETIIESLGAQTEALREEIAQIYETKLSKLRGEFEKNAVSLAFYREEYLKAVSSRSWKITSPLRAGTDLMHRLRRKSVR